ncbi:MAG TPA: hypothetical protein VHV30_06845 [Polyangiaceae bacterium]|jgi:hypothetical protein|nr:hypothetical protein [Polyangiaceae bacterium]
MQTLPRRAGRSFTSSVFAALAPVLVAAGLAGLATDCKSNPGDACSDTPGSCSDKASHLVCTGGKYVLETCKGAGGCADDKQLTCDNTKAEVGDGCGHDGARACSVDGTKELRCRGGSFAVEWSCKGGCTLDGSNNPKCVPTGNAGDVCRPDSIVCDTASQSELDCVDGKLVVARTCHGALGCVTPPGGGVRCDRTQALEGEECKTDGTGACDMQKKNVLVCTGGHFKTQLSCLGPIGCELPGNYSVRCDKSIVNENEPCTEDGSLSCTADGKQVKCADGKFGIDKKWKPKKDETCNNRYRVSFETEKFEAR